MEYLGSYEAKTNFASVLSQVEHGKSFVITRNGRPVAEIRPLQKPTADERMRAVRALRKEIALACGDEPILDADEDWREIVHRGHGE